MKKPYCINLLGYERYRKETDSLNLWVIARDDVQLQRIIAPVRHLIEMYEEMEQWFLDPELISAFQWDFHTGDTDNYQAALHQYIFEHAIAPEGELASGLSAPECGQISPKANNLSEQA